MRSGFAAILILGLVMAAFALGGAFYLKQKSSPTPPINNQPIIKSSPQASSSPADETVHTDEGSANWKTYANSVLGYTIKYPEGYKIQPLDERDIEITRIGVKYGGQEGKVALGGMGILYKGDNGLDSNDEIAVMQTKPTTINGYQARQTLKKTETPYVDGIYITDSNNKRVVGIGINTAGDVGFEERTYIIFHQILSTFTFSR